MNLFALKPHPYSKIFPEMSGARFSELVASVKKLGRIRNAVIVYQNQILDGKHRLRACKIANVAPKHIEFTGTDEAALDLVWDLNGNRRDLTESQRSVAFAEYCHFADTGRPEKDSHMTTLSEAADKVDVSKSTMARAKQVVKHGTKKQINSVRKGDATVSEVASEINAKRHKQNANGATDDMGFAVPGAAEGYWSRRPEAKNVLAQIQAARGQVKKLNADDPMWAEVNLNGVLGDLSNAINRFSAAVPAYVCVYCQGLKPKGCTTCKGRGVISRYMWSLVPEELRKMREKACK